MFTFPWHKLDQWSNLDKLHVCYLFSYSSRHSAFRRTYSKSKFVCGWNWEHRAYKVKFQRQRTGTLDTNISWNTYIPRETYFYDHKILINQCDKLDILQVWLSRRVPDFDPNSKPSLIPNYIVKGGILQSGERDPRFIQSFSSSLRIKTLLITVVRFE